MAIKYGEPPSNQMQMALPGLSDEGREVMDACRTWVGCHYAEFCWYMDESERRSKDGPVSPKLMVELMRDRFHVSIPNAFVPCFPRIAMERRKGLKFRLARSKVDGWTEATL